MKPALSPSMMCADLFLLEKTLSDFAASGIEYLHIDVMDGTFVPNFALGTDYCAFLRQKTDIPLDIHMMVADVDRKVDYFAFSEGDIVSVHAETATHLPRVLARIRERGAHPYVALNPATPLSFLDYILDDIDGVVVMTVNPGFAGQKMVPASLKKIADLRALLDGTGHSAVHIEVDGNVSFEKAPLMRKAGADIFVAGSSSVFSKEAALPENIAKMRRLLGE